MRPKRRGVAMAVIGGLLIVVLAPAAAVIGILIGVKGGISNVTGAPVVASGRSQHVAAGTEVMLFSYAGPTSAGNGVSDSSGASWADAGLCHVTDSSGTAVDVVTGSSSLRITRGGAAYHAAGHFTAPEDDDYTIACGEHPAMVLDSDIANHLLRDIFLPLGIGVGIAVLIAIVGLIVLIIGIVKITRSNREGREFDMQTAPGYAGGVPGYGPYPPQGPQYPPPPGPGNPYGPKS